MRSRGFTTAIGLALLAAACSRGSELDAVGPRGAQIASVLAAADEPYIRARPALAAGKYTRMALSPYDWFRGNVPLYRVDARAGTQPISVSRYGMPVPLVPSLGDAHPENFGILRASDGTGALEPNDFDGADRAPYLWDVRRLATGMAYAAMLANEGDAAAREATYAERRTIARAAAAAYRDGIERAARGEPLPRIDASAGAFVADLVRRSDRDAAKRAELDALTVLEEGKRRLVRGAPDATDAQNVLVDLPPFARDALPAALEGYRSSLFVPVAAEDLRILDAARELGSGVASWPRVRVLVLVRGPSDAPEDDVILELKEIGDSQISVGVPPYVHADDVGQRIVEATRSAWARPDAEPHWGTTSWLGLPCQVRLESEGQKNVRVSRMTGALGTPEALVALAKALGTIVARVHVTDRRAPAEGLERARAIWARMADDPEGFADEQADAAVAYADVTASDYVSFVRVVRALGLRLGLPVSPEDAPRPDLALLYGTPPAPPALPEAP